MSTQPNSITDDRGLLPASDYDETRLDTLHAVYHAAGEQAILATGIKAGSKVADIGCSIGNVALWLAQKVGDTGQVDAVDINAPQLAIAKARVALINRKINFHQQSVYNLDLTAASYDLVFSRLLLSQLPRPYEALQQLYKLVKPGGYLVMVEIDLTSIFTIPATDFYTEMTDLYLQSGKAAKLNYQIASQLPELFTQVGLSNLQLKLHQPIYKTGLCKQLWEQTFRNAGPAMVTQGLISQTKLDAIFRRMSQFALDENNWVAQARATIITGRKPNI